MDLQTGAAAPKTIVNRAYWGTVLLLTGILLVLFGLPASIMAVCIPETGEVRKGILMLAGGGILGVPILITGICSMRRARAQWRALVQTYWDGNTREFSWSEPIPRAHVGQAKEVFTAADACAYCGKPSTRPFRIFRSASWPKADWVNLLGLLCVPILGLPLYFWMAARLANRHRKDLGVPVGVQGVTIRFRGCRNCRQSYLWTVLPMGVSCVTTLLIAASGYLHDPSALKAMLVVLLLFSGFITAASAAIVSQWAHPFRISFKPHRIVIEAPSHLAISQASAKNSTQQEPLVQ